MCHKTHNNIYNRITLIHLGDPSVVTEKKMTTWKQCEITHNFKIPK